MVGSQHLQCDRRFADADSLLALRLSWQRRSRSLAGWSKRREHDKRQLQVARAYAPNAPKAIGQSLNNIFSHQVGGREYSDSAGRSRTTHSPHQHRRRAQRVRSANILSAREWAFDARTMKFLDPWWVMCMTAIGEAARMSRMSGCAAPLAAIGFRKGQNVTKLAGVSWRNEKLAKGTSHD